MNVTVKLEIEVDLENPDTDECAVVVFHTKLDSVNCAIVKTMEYLQQVAPSITMVCQSSRGEPDRPCWIIWCRTGTAGLVKDKLEKLLSAIKW